jgi:long-chain acyl-CoA synthetase
VRPVTLLAMPERRTDIITPEEAGTLFGLFLERQRRSPEAEAYRHYAVGRKRWVSTSWREVGTEVAKWQQAMLAEGLQPGDRVAVMARNSREWVVFDLAALGLGLVTVPLYTDDRPENLAYILNDAGAKLLLVDGREQWRRLQQVSDQLDELQRIVSIQVIEAQDEPRDPRLESLRTWLFGREGDLIEREIDRDQLATIVYTSGTTGRPKGVMLSHGNILSNTAASSQCADLYTGDLFLSFLPLSHMFERTGGYYLPMMGGAAVAYARSIQLLADDLASVRPTVLMSVPRIYERVYARIQGQLKSKSALARRLFELAVEVGWQRFEHRQGRAGWSWRLLLWPLLDRLVARKILARLGGRMRIAICGGAALPPGVARLFIGLGLDVLQGYGLTESSPVIAVNRVEDNVPASIGRPLPGLEVEIGENEELIARGPNIMLGYWKNPKATAAAIDEQGWLHTGDKARFDEAGRLFIVGRIKDIIVMGNGEKVPPNDMEQAIALDPLFEQVMVIGEGRPFLSALVVLSREHAGDLLQHCGYSVKDLASAIKDPCVEKAVLRRIGEQIREFPGHARVRQVVISETAWTVDSGMMTPTLKLKRNQIEARYAEHIDRLYKRHGLKAA